MKNTSSNSPRSSEARREIKVFGVKACRAVFKARQTDIIKTYIVEDLRSEFKGLLDWCVKNRKPFDVVREADLKKLSGSIHHEGIVMLTRVPKAIPLAEFLASCDSNSALLVLEEVGNPHNLGAALRAGAFFGINALVVVGENSAKISPAAMRVAQGAAEILPVIYCESVKEALLAIAAHDIEIVATSPHAKESLFGLKMKAPIAFLFGSEEKGLTKLALQLVDQTVKIPGADKVESLNLACSVTAVLTEFTRQRA